MRFKIFALLILCFLCFSCGEKQKETADQANISQSKSEKHWQITYTGDTILSGIPIPIQGKRSHLDNVVKPRKILLRGRPKVVPAHTNVHPAGNPRVVPIPDSLTVISPGENGIPMPRRLLKYPPCADFTRLFFIVR
jgi:hypothetical protein